MTKTGVSNRRGKTSRRAVQSSVLRVLVVENHADTRQGIRVFLDSLGYRALYAENMAEAIALSAKKDYDVLLSDISLPDGDGWELLETLNAGGRRPAHAIAMSGRSEPSDQARSRAVGFELHLVKPFAPEALAEVLRHVSDAATPPVPAPGLETLRQVDLARDLRHRIHDGLCQHIAAAALLQGALVSRLETLAERAAGADSGVVPDLVSDAQRIGNVLSEALDETRCLMRELNA